MSQVARAAEQLGFEAALTPTSSWCEDAWVMTAALTQLPATSSTWSPSVPACSRRPWRRRWRRPTSASRADRLLLNVVVGGDADRAAPLRRHDRQGRALRAGRRVPGDRARALERGGGRLLAASTTRSRAPACSTRPAWPTVYLGGSSPAALESPPSSADVFLTWGEPPEAVAEKLDAVREAADRDGPRARLRHPPPRDHPRHRRGGLGGRRPDARRASATSRSPRPSRSSGSPNPRASGG